MKEKTITSIIELAKHLHQNRYNRFNHTKTFDGNTPLDRLRSDFKIGFDVFGNSEQTYTYREKVQLAAEGHLAYQLLIQNSSSDAIRAFLGIPKAKQSHYKKKLGLMKRYSQALERVGSGFLEKQISQVVMEQSALVEKLITLFETMYNNRPIQIIDQQKTWLKLNTPA